MATADRAALGFCQGISMGSETSNTQKRYSSPLPQNKFSIYVELLFLCTARRCLALPGPAWPSPALHDPPRPCLALPGPAWPSPALPGPPKTWIALSGSAWAAPALPGPPRPCLALPCPALPCPALHFPCLALRCPAWSCPARPWPALRLSWINLCLSLQSVTQGEIVEQLKMMTAHTCQQSWINGKKKKRAQTSEHCYI